MCPWASKNKIASGQGTWAVRSGRLRPIRCCVPPLADCGIRGALYIHSLNSQNAEAMNVQSRPKRVSEPPENPGTGPVEVAEVASNRTGDGSVAPAANKAKKAPKVLLGLIAVAAIVGGIVWLVGRGKESTDDAQVRGACGHRQRANFRPSFQGVRVRQSSRQTGRRSGLNPSGRVDSAPRRGSSGPHGRRSVARVGIWDSYS